ncbi:MAG: hypothetical protein CMP75_03845 [Flavobacteriales bacterium]|nr:hypothetical protein [Flavobacteriales bacterium]
MLYMRCFLFSVGFYFFIGNVLAQQQISKTMIFDDDQREYIVYIPQGCNGNEACPLLFNFHGGSGYANDFIQTNDMRPIADTANFIAVYPQGAIDPEGGTTSWIHKAPTDHDDIFFIEAIIDTLSTQYLIDSDRIYACGYSEGAILSYELGCRLNSKIAAFAAVSGSMLDDYYRNDIYDWGTCEPIHPTAMMLIPGTIDENPHSTYEGLSYGDIPLYMSVEEITTFWSNYNSTDLEPITTIVENISPNDGSTVERKRWSNGDNCTSIQELKVIGGDHDWPGSFGNMDIDATTEIWNFVSKYNSNGLIDCHNTDVKETDANLRVFPNPVTNFLTIKSEISNHQTYSIYSILGKKLLAGTISEDETINTSTLPSDIYILKIGTKNIKFLKL